MDVQLTAVLVTIGPVLLCHHPFIPSSDDQGGCHRGPTMLVGPNCHSKPRYLRVFSGLVESHAS